MISSVALNHKANAPSVRAMPEANRTCIEVRDLDVFYGKTRALKKICMDVRENRVTALIGPSGCGKSTFLRTLNRMNDLIDSFRAEGAVRINGQDIYDDRVDVVELRRRVGMVFQRPNPFPKSIFENVVYGPRRHGVRRRSELEAIAEESLRQAALWDEVKDRLNDSALDLSGGQQQRLCIARALAVKPEALLLDEPASALDPIAAGKIEELIQALKETYTIVIVTHNMQQARRASDETAFFLAGELIEHGHTDEVFNNPKDTRTHDYLSGRFG